MLRGMTPRRLSGPADTLAGLFDRASIEETCRLAMRAVGDDGTGRFALAVVNVDRFRQVNGALGHNAGDEALAALAANLRSVLAEEESLARLSGDEFAIFIPAFAGIVELRQRLQRFVEAAKRPIVLAAETIGLSVSVGVACYPEAGDSFHELLRHANLALGEAKASGRTLCLPGDIGRNGEVRDRLTLECAFRRAIQDRGLSLDYHPIVDLGNGRIVGGEGLLRWRAGDGSSVPPSAFIPIAEESGLIEPVGQWVLEEACRQGRQWIDTFQADLTIAVNVSARQIRGGLLVEQVCHALEGSGLPPGCLELEFTESTLIDDLDEAMEAIRCLRDKGVRFSLDDFGTGFSSLAYVRKLHVDALKIDQSFVRDMLVDDKVAAIVSAVMQLARSLGLKTVAEGVASAETAAALVVARCDFAQGYYFGRPMPASDFERALQRQSLGELPRAEP